MSQKIEFESALNRAVTYWLKYEAACGRTRIFSEKILSYPIGDYLSAKFGKKFHVEFNFDFSGHGSQQRGRPTQLDYAVTRKEKRRQNDLV